MLVSVTRARLRSARFWFLFAWQTLHVRKQLRGAAGFCEGVLLQDRHLAFWTMTLWEDEACMRAFYLNGAHKAAMPKFTNWCDESSVVHWQQSDAHLPSWEEADRRMRQSGRPSKLRYPSPQHQAMSFPTPRTTATVSMAPQQA